MIVLRIHGDELMFGGSGTVMTHSPRIPQMEMMKVHIPFTFKLHESFKSTYTGEFFPQIIYSPYFSFFFSFNSLSFLPFLFQFSKIFGKILVRNFSPRIINTGQVNRYTIPNAGYAIIETYK